MLKPLSFLSRFFNRRADSAGVITQGTQISRPGATVTLSAPRRFHLSIDKYMEAVSAADSLEWARRSRLYDIYADIATDTHVIAVTQKRTNSVKAARIEFRRDGIRVPEVCDQIESPWFLRFLEDAFESRYWGFSLFQFFRNPQGWIDYTLVPRKHVDPDLREIHRLQTDLRGKPFSDFSNLLLVEDKRRLGLYLSLCPWVIWKRDAFGDWAQFSELFGIPMRKYTYDAADPEALQACISAAAEQGNSSVLFVPVGANLELIETANAATSSDLYERRAERCNAEISKAILGNTLTTESAERGTQALGTVHKKAEDELAREDRQFILNLLNFEMSDIFNALGVNTRGGEFVYVSDEDPYTLAQRASNLRTLVIDLGLPVEKEVAYQTLGIPMPQTNVSPDDLISRLPAPASPASPDAPGGSPTAVPTNSAAPFFVHAPHDGALEW